MKDNKYIKGGIAVMAVLLTAIIVILISVFSKSNNIDDKETNSTNFVSSETESTCNTIILETNEKDTTTVDENIDVTDDNRDTSKEIQTSVEQSSSNNTVAQHETVIQQTTVVEHTVGIQQATTTVQTVKQESTSEQNTIDQSTTIQKDSFKCTIAIYCKTILDNMDDLKESKKPYVPNDGVILEIVEITVYENETVFDVLKRVCNEKGIAISCKGGTKFEPAYIKSIGNIAEFDCTSTSGWKYCVNGVYPAYSCDQYILQKNDIIIWNYTCKLNDI